MTWRIPAKTFLVGEYLALIDGPALVLSTQPCFEMHLLAQQDQGSIHPASPAGRWWQQQGHRQWSLMFEDPYQGCGGLGASSAQFIGAYLASLSLHDPGKKVEHEGILAAYWRSAWSGKGLRPSGYDILAQLSQACVYLHRKQNIYQSYPWSFSHLGFILLHTGKKLATHEHLQQQALLPKSVQLLAGIVEQAQGALLQTDEQALIDAVNAYQDALAALNFVAEHSFKLIQKLKAHPDVLAIKGCGAMGADVLLVLVHRQQQAKLAEDIMAQGLRVLATDNDLM